MDRAKGLYDFLQSFVSNVVRDFLSDRTKSPELRNLEFQSEDRIDARQKQLEEDGELPNDARVQAVEEEIALLQKEASPLENIAPRNRTDAQDDRLNALNARIKELQTGEVTTDRLNFFADKFFGKEIRDTIKREGPFLKEGTDYLNMSEDEKLENLEKLFRKFKQGGNDPSRIQEIYLQELKTLKDPNRIAQAKDMISFARIRDQNILDKKSEDFNLKQQFEPFSGAETNVKPMSNGNKKVSTENTGVGGSGEKTAFNPKISGGGSGLAQQPVSASSSPEMVVHMNFDPDNQYRDSNASLLGIFAV